MNLALKFADMRNIGYEEGKFEGERKGRKDGARAEKIETAKLMKQSNMPIDSIIKFTGLKLEEVELI